MGVKGEAIGKYKPCKWCKSKNTIIGTSRRLLCNDCGGTTSRFIDRPREITEEQKMNRPWCIKDRVVMWSKGAHWWCDMCGVTMKKHTTPHVIYSMNLRAIIRPDCIFCGTPSPHSNRNDWKCVNPKCRRYWPKEPKESQLLQQPIEEVLIA